MNPIRAHPRFKQSSDHYIRQNGPERSFTTPEISPVLLCLREKTNDPKRNTFNYSQLLLYFVVSQLLNTNIAIGSSQKISTYLSAQNWQTLIRPSDSKQKVA